MTALLYLAFYIMVLCDVFVFDSVMHNLWLSLKQSSPDGAFKLSEPVRNVIFEFVVENMSVYKAKHLSFEKLSKSTQKDL